MKILVVGCGSIGNRHTMNLHALGVEEILVTDPDPVKRAKVAADHGALAVSTVDDALHQKPDAVVICTPPNLHVELAKQAVRNGCHCLVEKPISDRIEGLEELFAEAEVRHRILLVGYNLRYEPGLIEVQELLAQDAIGRVIYVRAEIGSYLANWRPGQDYRFSYTAKKAMGGGSSLMLLMNSTK